MDKKLVGLMLVFMISFGLFTTIAVFNKPLTQFIKAKEEFLPSSESSLIFAWPLTAKTDSKNSIQVNVFVRNANNVPLANKTVHLSSTLGTIRENDQVTDKAGKTSFILTSENSGIAEITAMVDNQIELKQKVSIKFE